MARQRVHNRRAGRGSSGGGASWISYSDMMAALLLVFVLILSVSLYQYFTMLETKQAELDLQQQTLDEQTILLAAQQTTLDEQAAALALTQTELDSQTAALLLAQQSLEAQQLALDAAKAELTTMQLLLLQQQTELDSKQAELDAATLLLSNQQAELDAATLMLSSQQAALDAQAQKIDDLVGIRTQIISELSSALSASNLRATVDPDTGDILLDSAVFFKTNSDEIMADGQALLNRFIPVYLGVLLQPEYADYLGEIIIEGHTDTSGSYMTNLRLSQERALSVATYCLEMPSLTSTQQTLLRSILTATGRSYSDPVLNPDGSVNMGASRRVEFKFSLKDAEMIEEMNRLLQGN
ncbi:MAG: OmpA family protein [Clostridia bacterium]|nr:OmpA family protein [Clostridia bacterium]